MKKPFRVLREATPASRKDRDRAVLQPGPRLPYAMRLTVAVTGSTGETRRLDVRLPADPRATIVLPGFFRDKPTRVVVDPDAVLLARIITL